MVWNSLDRRRRNSEKLDALKVALNRKETSLNKITFNKGTTVNLSVDIFVLLNLILITLQNFFLNLVGINLELVGYFSLVVNSQFLF